MRSLPIALCLVAACSDAPEEPPLLRQGGDTTVDDRTRDAFNHPAPNLRDDERRDAQLGRGPFDFHWEAPLLGPLFNNDACVGCHGGHGRGLSLIGNGAIVSQGLIRVSLADGTPEEPGGDVPVPGLGLQLQDHATSGLPEVTVTLAWTEHAEAFGDGEVVMLRAPVVTPRRPDGTLLPPEILMSYRQGPPVFGLGLLEAIPDAALTDQADPDDRDRDGISGRANLVWDPARQATAIGRFGHKASVATLRHQTAAAFASDMGLSSVELPEPDGMRDVSDSQFAQTLLFVSTIAVPAAAPQDATARRGRALFTQLGCAACHTPTQVTGDHPIAALAHQTIHPYTDLLLHDLGPQLSDGRRDVQAEGAEWRTAPLWGLGLAQVVTREATFLHDGRARTLAEAILWHGGEAQAAREAFRLADQRDRAALIGFLQTL